MKAPSRFAAWVSERYPSPLDALAAYFEDAQAAAASVGALLESMPALDGAWHKLPNLAGRNEQDRSYKGELVTDRDGTVWPSVTFTALGREGIYWKPRDLAFQEWRSTGGQSSADDNGARMAEYRRKAAEMQAQAEADKAAAEDQKREAQEAAAMAANEAWEAATPCAGHAYLTRKGVQAHGLRVVSADHRARLWSDKLGKWLPRAIVARRGELLVPMLDASGRVWNVQRIDAEGGKQFVMGGRKRGTFHRIAGTGPAWAAEGYATAATVHAATGCPVVVAFDAGNLAAVAAELPELQRVAADNDENAAGLKGAKAAGLPYVMPSVVGQDWNDAAAALGLESVAQLLTLPVKPAEPAANGTLAPDDGQFDDVDVHSMTPVQFMSWPNTSDKGMPLNTRPNLEHLLENYGITVRYDVVRKDLVIRLPGQRGTLDNMRETAITEVSSLCALNRMPKSDVPAYLLSIGDLSPVNPVMDFITSKPWDGRSRVADLLQTISTQPGFDREWMALLVRRWLISAVAAAAKPHGFVSKGVLVFQGPQSSGKTSWFRSLLPEQMRDLLKVDAHIDPDNKDTVISAVSHWLCELGELDGTLRKADIARLKGFLSQDVDQFRRPYARAEGKYQRRTVFFASVNPEQFLADDTGNVRWWTVPVTSLDYGHNIDTQQLWAEVFTWFQAGERWWLDASEEARLSSANAAHESADPVGELIQSRYGMAPAGAATRSITATEILLEIGYDRPTKAQLNAAGSVLRALFGEAKRTKAGRLFDVPSQSAGRPF